MLRTRERTSNSDNLYTSVNSAGSVSVYKTTWSRVEKCVDEGRTEWKTVRGLLRQSKNPKNSPKLQARYRFMYDWAMQHRDMGGSFQKDSYERSGHRDVRTYRSGWNSSIVGSVRPATLGGSLSFLAPTPQESLFAVGGALVRRTAPTNPHAQLATALAELKREGIPSVTGVKLLKDRHESFLKRGAGEYLNWEFGWKPLLGDLGDFIDARQNADRYWQQTLRNSNRPVSRKFVLDPVVSTTVTDTGNQYPTPSGITQMHLNAGKGRRETITSTQYWFKGVFRYNIPDSPSVPDKVRRKLAELRTVYGLSIDPYTLWNLVPWSWLIDWVVDFGGLMKALSLIGSDGLVLQYGYLMEHKTVTVRDHVTGHRYYDGTSGDTVTTTLRESKRRVRASPFGFGVNEDSLTPRQYAILAAIGISHRPS